jgi:LuxR family transcriptional regulator, maltose regulon positive regulatory protein
VSLIARPVTPHHRVPALPHPLVRRPRLEALLDDAERRHITLVSGLPGAGKTTLVASWLRSVDQPAAWVGLDGRANEPGRLARSMAAALASMTGVPEAPARRRRSDAAIVDQALGAVPGGPWVLVLDDVHELRSPEALSTLRHLLDRSPPNLSLVLCARADPPVALGRLRLDGRLGEIRNADLEFSVTETAELFAAYGIDLRHDDVQALWYRTQGWIAGLRLAVGALDAALDRRELVRSATATEAAVADYLLEEVLDRQDAGTQDFLLRTSVVDRLTPGLAAVLADDAAACERLDDLERSGVFLIDVSDGGWYRYHTLFADLLRASLRRRHPELVGELHRRAAAWSLAHGHPADAERHARQAGDWELVGRLAAERWLVAALDDAEPHPDPVAEVPPGVVGRTADLAVVAAARACARGGRDDADLHRTRVDDLVGPLDGQGGGTADPDGARAARRRLLDLNHGWAFGADVRSRRAARALAAAGEAGHDATGTAPALRHLARLRGAEADVDDGRFDAAVAALRALSDGPDDDWVWAEAAGVLAVVEAANGNLAGAERRTAAVLAVDPAELRPTALLAAHLARALTCAQRGERRGAAAHLAAAGDVGRVAARPLAVVLSTLQAALGGSSPHTAWLDTATAAHPLAAQALIACGALEVVDPQRRLVAVGGPSERAVVRARQELARGAPDAARAALDRALAGNRSAVHLRTVIEALTLAAITAAAGRDEDEARAHLREALGLVAASGVRAPLLDHAPALTDLLERETVDVEHRGLALDLLDHLRRAPAGSPVETLTERETAVLQFLPTLMSNAEIADGLHLSINTVKSHLKAVYRKLGVEGRRDAVLRGRELELI